MTATHSTMFTDSDLVRLQAAFDEPTLTRLLLLNDGDKIDFDLCDKDGDEMDDYYLTQAAIAAWDDDCGEHIYQLGERAFAHKSHSKWQGLFDADSVEAFLSCWDNDDCGSYEGRLVSFGISPELDEAPEDYVGECKIWCEQNYYQSHTNPPSDGWVTEDDVGQWAGGNPQTFESYAAALEWIEETEDNARGYKSETHPRGSYMLSHGQASPPSYTICKA